MADEGNQQRDPSSDSTGQPPRDGAGSHSNRRRIIVAGLLTPPAVMTLGARSAGAGKKQQADPSANCTASLQANPHASHPCGVLP